MSKKKILSRGNVVELCTAVAKGTRRPQAILPIDGIRSYYSAPGDTGKDMAGYGVYLFNANFSSSDNWMVRGASTSQWNIPLQEYGRVDEEGVVRPCEGSVFYCLENGWCYTVLSGVPVKGWRMDGMSEWEGTQVEYDALGEYDADTTYYILEDE